MDKEIKDLNSQTPLSFSDMGEIDGVLQDFR